MEIYLIENIFVAPIVCGGSVFRLCFVIRYFVSVLFCNYLVGEERVGCFALTAFQIPYDSHYSVALPRGAMGCYAVCSCGISISYSLAFSSTLHTYV